MISLSKKWWHINRDHCGRVIPGRQGCYFYSSDSMEKVYYLLLCKKKNKKEEDDEEEEETCVLLSIKNDTQHHWDPLQKSAVTLSPIIHKTLLLWSTPTCFLSPGALPLPVILILVLPPGTVALMSCLISQGFGCAFTFGIHRETDRPRVPTLHQTCSAW